MIGTSPECSHHLLFISTDSQSCEYKSLIERIYYRPQTKFAKVMFSQVSVCPQEGVCHPLGRPRQADIPWADTPCPVHAGIHPPAQCMLGYTHHPLPSACWDTHTPWPVHAGIHTPTPSACWDTVNKREVRIPLECIIVFNEIKLSVSDKWVIV